jgi:N-acetylmuramoyl-L-alanine amidase
MIVPSKPDADGKIIHVVAPYQTLITISQAYGTTVDTILAVNSIQADWPLQIGQKLMISKGRITPSPTPRPLTPIERLTPQADGKYYHVVRNGENFSSIATLYGIRVNDLMAWNSMNSGSILYPDQKLLLQVTPPATPTFTPGPPTATKKPTRIPPTPTPTRTSMSPTISPTAAVAEATFGGGTSFVPYIIVALAACGLFLVVFFSIKRH